MRLNYMLLLCLLFFRFLAQEDYTAKQPRDYLKKPAKNSAFFEFGGNAGLYSLNFDRIYYYGNKLKLSARIGSAINMNGIYYEPVFVLENNFILLQNPHHLELGLGGTLQRRFNEKEKQPDVYFWENILFSVWRCGYRYQKINDGFFVRAALTPVFTSNDALGFHSNYFQFWLGASIGTSW